MFEAAAFSSNFLATIDSTACNGCRKCFKACPVDAIEMIEQPRKVGKKRIKWLAKVDPSICIGCGVCALQCKYESMSMQPRPQRRVVPESIFERTLTMALERGTLHELLLDQDEGLPARAANALLGTILNLPPSKQALAKETIKSRFVEAMLAGAKATKMLDTDLK
jgi:ferredoxin